MERKAKLPGLPQVGALRTLRDKVKPAFAAVEFRYRGIGPYKLQI